MNEPAFADWLQLPPTAITYHAREAVRTWFSNRALVEANADSFDLLAFADAKRCLLKPKADGTRNQIAIDWEGPGDGLTHKLLNGWFDVQWEGHGIEVVYLSWPSDCGHKRHCFLLAHRPDIAERFFEAVCEWGAETRGEVLVFEDGCWAKNAELYRAIRNARFDNLVLPPTLKQEIAADFARFFAAREQYEKYNIPWKRGVLLVGPPGNGKTHTVKALVNTCGVPCLYIKSFTSEYGTDQDNIRKVFKRARQTTPCLLVLEDLDALITDANRAFFLNELDGFAENTGIVTIASTNHPDRLDPAIVQRPSRFDRKYYFDLPAARERSEYIRLWNRDLTAELRLTDTQVETASETTNGFSFAYLKELFVSALIGWVNRQESAQTESLFDVMRTQTTLLREQMRGPQPEQPT